MHHQRALSTHTLMRCLTPRGSCVRSIKQIFHSQLSNRSCSMLGAHTAAGSTIDPVKAHTYKLAVNGRTQTCVCVCTQELFFSHHSPAIESFYQHSLFSLHYSLLILQSCHVRWNMSRDPSYFVPISDLLNHAFSILKTLISL